MLRNVINSKHTTELFKVATDTKRGSVVVKNLTTGLADKADRVGTEVYLLDFDFQPTGYQSDMEISDYTAQADTVKEGTYGILIKYVNGEKFATDQVITTGLTAGDYAIAGTTTNVGKLVKAVSTNVSVFKYQGTYADGDKTLYMFEVVEPKTIA